MAPLPPSIGRRALAAVSLLALAAGACARPAPLPDVALGFGFAPSLTAYARGLLPLPDALPEPEVVLPEISSLALARQVLTAEAPQLDEEVREAVARVLADGEQHQGIDVLLALAVITQESRFDPQAVGPRGSLGLMQIRPFVGQDVARRYDLPWAGPRTLHDPAHNVRIGLLYFAELLAMFGDTEHALAAYNMGPYRLKRLLRRYEEPPRMRYPERVRGHWQDLAERFPLPGDTAWGG